jgi:hypothetical protein
MLMLTLSGTAEYRVRTLYPYDGQRAEDLCESSFRPLAHYLLVL